MCTTQTAGANTNSWGNDILRSLHREEMKRRENIQGRGKRYLKFEWLQLGTILKHKKTTNYLILQLPGKRGR